MSKKPNLTVQPIPDDSTHDLRNVGANGQENSVKPPNNQAQRPLQNRSTRKSAAAPYWPTPAPTTKAEGREEKETGRPTARSITNSLGKLDGYGVIPGAALLFQSDSSSSAIWTAFSAAPLSN